MIPEDLYEKAWNGEITREDALRLYRERPHDLFSLADELRGDAVGDVVTYIVNRNINFTNKCIGDCGFCAFKRDDGYVLGLDDILEKTGEAMASGATELCIQGGLLPDMQVDDYCLILESIKDRFNVHIHAYSPMEVYHMARNTGVEVEDALAELKNAGLDSMPGTAAEILVDRVREKICPAKLSTEEWVSVVKSAHRMGIPTTATIMYGHIETLEDRLEHLFLIREIQEDTGRFTEFVPLPFMPRNNRIGGMGATGLDDLKLHALARIIFHGRIDNIQASWVKLGKKLAQWALFCGANDLGGTLMEENISKSAGATTGEYMSPEEFEYIIRDAGRVPRQRTTLYNLSSKQPATLKEP